MRGERYVVGDELPLLAQAQREVAAESAGSSVHPGDAPPGCSFIAPLDPLLWDRGALGPLYDFDYRWEVYTPSAKRRWGYYVLPILFGDRLVGRIEPRLDRPAKTVRILGLAWEPGFDPMETPGFVAAFSSAMNAYLAFGAAETVAAPPEPSNRPLFRAIAPVVKVDRGSGSAKSPRKSTYHTRRATAAATDAVAAAAAAGATPVGAE
jgi:uncharacterized protein YcaQ